MARKRYADGLLRDGLRGNEWRRKQNYRKASRKKRILQESFQWNYPHSINHLSKNKVHCGCKMCKPWKHFKGKDWEKISDKRKREMLESMMEDFDV